MGINSLITLTMIQNHEEAIERVFSNAQDLPRPCRPYVRACSHSDIKASMFPASTLNQGLRYETCLCKWPARRKILFLIALPGGSAAARQTTRRQPKPRGYRIGIETE
jgi:hypothetical protein